MVFRRIAHEAIELYPLIPLAACAAVRYAFYQVSISSFCRGMIFRFSGRDYVIAVGLVSR